MLGSAAMPAFPLDYEAGPGIKLSRKGARFRFDLRNPAIPTTGSLNAYAVTTPAGIGALEAGINVLVEADRTNTGPCFLNVDGTGPLPWLDAGSAEQGAGRIIAGRYYLCFFDAELVAWKILAGATTLDEIPGFSAGVQTVQTGAAQVAQDAAAVASNAQTVATQAAQVATQSAQVASNAAEAAAASALATAARDQAVANATAGSLRFPTVAALLAFVPADATKTYYADVDGDAAGNGRYAWNGAAPWTLVTAVTLASIDTRVGTFEGTPGPSAGYADSATLISSIVVDRAGGALSYAGIDRRSRRAVGRGMWALPGGGETGPSVGYTLGRTPSPSVTLDSGRAPLAQAAGDGRVWRPDPAGVWRADYRSIVGPSAGYGDALPDSLLATVQTDPAGGLIRAQGAGSASRGSDFLATAAGLVRLDVPREPGNLARRSVLTVPSVRLQTALGWTATPPAVLAPSQPGSALFSTNGTLTNGGKILLPYQTVSSVTVRRNSDNAVLTAGTDYALDLDRGTIYGTAASAGTAVTIAGTGHPMRVDYVVADQATGAVSLVEGTARPRAASMWEPSIPAGKRALFRVLWFVDDARTSYRGDLAPVHLYRGRVRRDRAGEIEGEIAGNRRRLERSRRKLIRSTTFLLGGYGDSRTQMGGAINPALYTAPGGTRDRIGYFETYDAETLARVAQYGDPGDGSGIRVREGWNWFLQRYLERAYGSTVTYRNWGVSGTDSTAGTGSSGSDIRYHGLNPNRLPNVVADNCDLMVVAFGMNELGASFTYANLCAITKAFLDANTDVILVGVPPPNRRWQDRVADVRYTNAAIRAAAEDMDVAFANVSRILDPVTLGAAGVSEVEYGDASMQNHESKKQLDVIGSLLTELF